MSEEMESFNCSSCGIYFGIDKKVAALWKNSHKKFLCPNNHTLSWSEPSADEKELAALRIEVKELKEKLAAALSDIEGHRTKVTTLESELELYGIKQIEVKLLEAHNP